MSCLAEIIIEQHSDARYVPVQAVMRIGGEPTVYAWQEKKFEPRKVRTGLDNNRMIHIIEGLNEGEAVLLTPPLKAAAADSQTAGIGQQDDSLTAGFRHGFNSFGFVLSDFSCDRPVLQFAGTALPDGLKIMLGKLHQLSAPLGFHEILHIRYALGVSREQILLFRWIVFEIEEHLSGAFVRGSSVNLYVLPISLAEAHVAA